MPVHEDIVLFQKLSELIVSGAELLRNTHARFFLNVSQWGEKSFLKKHSYIEHAKWLECQVGWFEKETNQFWFEPVLSKWIKDDSFQRLFAMYPRNSKFPCEMITQMINKKNAPSEIFLSHYEL